MSNEILELIARIKNHMIEANHRALVVLEGNRNWSLGIVESVRQQLPDARTVCISEALSEAHVPATNLVYKLVGQEFDLAIYDAWSGLDPNMLGGLSGTLLGGGLFILCTPIQVQWPGYQDPVCKRVISYPQVSTGHSHYLQRFIRVLNQSPNVYMIRQDAPLPALGPAPDFVAEENRMYLQDQQNAVTAILQQCTGHAHRPLVILADRGRGKSAALGMASAELMQQEKKIILSATRKQAASIVYKHIDLTFDAHGIRHLDRETKMDHLRFVPPDALAYDEHHADLVIIDEAATIGISLLTRILKRYPRIVFASTINGYEGTGRGLELKFFPHLEQKAPGWKLLQLQNPIRWKKNDPLEVFMNKALLLKHDLPILQNTDSLDLDQIKMRSISASELVDNESLLQQIYGLLVISHYRTTPLDLRIILDNPAVRIHYAHIGGQIVATAMTILEGNIQDEWLNAQIASGNRRVHGHLLPQALSYYSGIAKSMTLACLRVVRIAVYPYLQRKGIGSRLLEYIEDNMAEKCDYIGTSFALDETVLPIWHKARFRVVRVGFTTGSTSGQQAAFMVKGLSLRGKSYVQVWKKYHDRNFSPSIPVLYRNIRPELLAILMADAVPTQETELTDVDRKSLEDFIYQQKEVDFVFGPVQRLVRKASLTNRIEALNACEKAVILLRFIQMEDWKAIQHNTGVVGKKQIIVLIREAVRKLYEHTRS